MRETTLGDPGPQGNSGTTSDTDELRRRLDELEQRAQDDARRRAIGRR